MTLPASRLPGPSSALPHVGLRNAIHLMSSPVTMVRELAEHGRLVRFDLGPRHPVTLVNDPSLVTNIFQRPALWHDQTRVRDAVRGILGEGLFAMEAPDAKERRKVLTETFSAAHWQEAQPKLEKVIEEVLGKWDRAISPINFAEEARHLSLRLFCQLSFGYDVSQTDILIDAMQGLHELIAGDIPFPIKLSFLPHRWLAKVYHLHRLDNEIKKLLPENIKAEGADLYKRLSDKIAPDHESIMAELRTLLFGSYESSASLMTATLYEMAMHPEIYAQLKQAIGTEALEKLCLDVVDEVLRLHPPTFLLTRIAVQTTELGGYTFSAGEEMFMCPALLQRDAMAWDQPNEFKLGRPFAEQQKRGSYLPFGMGARACIGRYLARQEAALLLRKVVELGFIELIRNHGFSERLSLFFGSERLYGHFSKKQPNSQQPGTSPAPERVSHHAA